MIYFSYKENDMTVNELKETLMSGKNPELEQKIAAAKTVSDAYKIAVEAGMTGSEEEFSAAVNSVFAGTHELPEEVLKQIAGGAANDFWGWPKMHFL